MKKKVVSVILVGCLMISCIGWISADTDIVNSMDFQGEAVKLSLNEAIDRALTESVSGKTIEWNEKKAEAEYWEFMENSDDIDAVWDAGISYASTRSDAEILEFTGRFYREQRKRNKTAEQNALKAQVIEVYFSINNLNELVEINRENVKVRQTLYDNCKTKFELGMVAKQDVLKAEYEMMNAQTTYEESVVNLKNAKMSFNLLLGYEPMQEVVLTDTISENAHAEDISIADAVSQALLERNEIYAAKFQFDLAEMTMESLKKKTVSASHHKKQKVALEQSIVEYPIAFDKVEMDVREKYMDMQQKKAAIETSKKSVEALEEALRLVQLSYEAGLSILTDVQELQTQVFQAKVGLSNTILDYNLAVDAFNESMGAGRFVVPLS